mgnify:CR=1 FL=1
MENILNKYKDKIILPIDIATSDNEIKIVDVKVAESSLLLSYRGKFYEMIAQDDGEIDWFLEDLNDKTVTMEKNLNQNARSQQNSLEIEDKTR